MKRLLSIVCVAVVVALGVWAFSRRSSDGSRDIAAAEKQARAAAAPVQASSTASAASATANSAPAAPASAPASANAGTAERLRARALTRWTVIARGDWIDAYTYLTPEQQRGVPIAQFLSGKNFHHYDNPAVERVIALEDAHGYVAVRALWTPDHPELKRVKLEPGQSLSEELHMVETWRWAGDDWYFVDAQSQTEFFAAHPALAGR
jgi:hypothetical protein